MASEGPNNPGTVVDDGSIGTRAWSNPSNAKVSDDQYATTSYMGTFSVYDESVKIVKSDGSFGTEDKANKTTRWPSSDTYFSYGGATDLWSETWTPSDINSSNFGVAIAARSSAFGTTHYLKATNFGFSIPAGATINGILAEVEKKHSSNLYVDHIRITVYYTEGGAIEKSVSDVGSVSGSISKANLILIGDQNLSGISYF